MKRVVQIARCPEHGLHGERTECFICGGPVEQVPMVSATDLWVAIAALSWAVGYLSVTDPGRRTYPARVLEHLVATHG